MALEVVLSGLAAMLLSAVRMSHFLSSRPHVGDHGETTRMAQDCGGACWWAACWVGHYGSSGVVVFWGLGEISVGLFDIDAVTPVGAAFFPEGHRVYPFPTPLCVLGETLGLVLAAAASLSFSFLKVLLGTRCFDVLGAWWEFSGERSGGGSSLYR
jgi:hypothetical protein